MINNKTSTDILLALIRCALTKKAATVPSDTDWNTIYELAVTHQIVPMIYYGMYYSSVDIPSALLQKYKTVLYSSALTDERQTLAVKQITEKFEANGIDYLPLKGIILKPLYYDPLLRVMSDADIMIRLEQYELIKIIMSELGFISGVESDHELVWYRNGVIIELHKRLIPSYNKDYYAYYGDGWRLAKPDIGDAHRYHLDQNDELIYLFTHFAKHYRDGGIGIRHLVDLYIYIKANAKLNPNYIETELKRLQLLNFYRNICHTIDVWFNGEAPDDMSDFITERIFSSGSYGTDESKIIASTVKESKNHSSAYATRLYRIKEILFPPYQTLSSRYALLRKMPLLLPVFWIVRIFDTLKNKRQNIKNQHNNLNLLTTVNIQSYQSELNYVGLDFNFTK